VVVTGFFDVLRPAHIRGLAAVRQDTPGASLMAVLLPWPNALLSIRARAELVAGLSVVDYVVTELDGSVQEFLAGFSADEVVSRQAADETEQRLLMEHVHARHSV
jgi:hypothetical protein